MKENKSEKKTRVPYREPKAAVIEMDTSGVLCQSGGNSGMYEYDYGDGGFN